MADQWIKEVGPDHIVIDFSGLNQQSYSFLLASYLCWIKQTCGDCWISKNPTTVHFKQKTFVYNPKILQNIFVHAFWILFRCQKCFKHELPVMTFKDRQQLESPIFDLTQTSFTGKCFQCQSSFTKPTVSSFPNDALMWHWFRTLNVEKSKEQKQEPILESVSLEMPRNDTTKLIFPLPLPSLYMQTNHDYSISFTSKTIGNRVFCNECDTYECGHGLSDWRPKPVGLILKEESKEQKSVNLTLQEESKEQKELALTQLKMDLQTEDIETFGTLFLDTIPMISQEIKLQEPYDLIWKTPFDSKQKAMMHALCSNLSLEQQSQFIMNGLVYFLRVESMGSEDPSSTIQSIFSTMLEPFEYYFLRSRVNRCHMFHSMMTWAARNKMLDNWKPLQHVFESILGICGTEKLLSSNHVLDWFEWDKKQMPHRLSHRRLDAANFFCNEIGPEHGKFLQLLKNNIIADHKRQKQEEKEEQNETGQMSLPNTGLLEQQLPNMGLLEQQLPPILSFLPFKRKRKREESDDELANVNCMQLKYARVNTPVNHETTENDIYDSEIQKYQFSSDTEKADQSEQDEDQDNPYTMAQRIKATRRKNKRRRSDDSDPDC
jgi:hypothetical protein